MSQPRRYPPGVPCWVDAEQPDPDAACRFYGKLFGWTFEDAVPAFRLWQPRNRLGAQVVNVAGAWNFSDLHTNDPDIRSRQAAAPDGFEDAIGWLAPLAPGEPGPRWHVTFTVADRDDAVSVAQRMGAEVTLTAETMWTRSAVIRDPQGAELTLSQFTPPDDWG